MLGERLSEELDVRPGRRVGNADDLCAVGAKQGLEIEVARVVDEHRVAGLEQETAQEVHCLCPGFRQHDLVG